MKRKSANKALVLFVALVLVVGCVVGGTIAWLTDTTTAVKNTFTYGDINITLAETTGTEYKMIPGSTIDKDPKVTVVKDSEACYLFVKVEKSDNFDTFMTYTMADGWTQGDGTAIPSNVFYRIVPTGTANQGFAILNNNQVNVLYTVTKEQLSKLTDETNPTLTFTAYAVQQANVDSAAAAWAIVAA